MMAFFLLFFKITPSRLPSVVRSLLAIDYNSVAIQDLIISVQGDYSMDDLVEVLEERNRYNQDILFFS